MRARKNGKADGDSWGGGEFDCGFVVFEDNGWRQLWMAKISGELAKIDDVLGAFSEGFVFYFAGVE